jgi:hypothetical protein
MAMAPQDFTIHGLSIEFGLHKEVVAQRLREVEPRRIDGKTRFYRISDVAKYLVGKSAVAEGEPDRAKAEARRALAEAEIAEAKSAQIKGELAPVEETATELERAFTAVRARLLSIPPKLAPILAPENPARARVVLERAVLEALAELEQTDVFEDEVVEEVGSA